MRRLNFLPVHLPRVLTLLILTWALVSCTGSAPTPSNGGRPTPAPALTAPATTLAPTPEATIVPTPSVSASPALASEESIILFQDLAQGFQLSSVQTSPAVHMAVDPQSLGDLMALVAPEHQVLLQGVDLDNEAILGAFWGAKPSGGFSITINKIISTPDDLIVDVILKENDPTVPRIEAFTFPYHVVTVDRAALPKDTGLQYRLTNGDDVMAEGSLP